MARQSKAQRETVGRVMHEFKHGELRMGGKGPKVKNPKQAIAIALREAGASRQESPKANRRNLARTKAKERRGETARAASQGRGRRSGSSRSGETKAALYERAKTRNIPGRSRMSKAELERALA